MSEVGRNEPCPCGSGQKYKKCCIDRVVPFPGPDTAMLNASSGLKTASETSSMIARHLEGRSFESLDPANEYLTRISRRLNQAPVSAFLGLSPDQMHRTIYSPFRFNTDFVFFNDKNPSRLEEIPLLNQALYFLNRVKDAKQMKATQKGNLPRAFVRELHKKFFKNELFSFTPNNEQDCPQAERLKHLLMMSGFLKKRLNKYSLTKRGENVLKTPSELYLNLFYTLANKFNWGYLDRYPQFQIIQNALAFNLLLLLKKASNWVPNKELGRFFLEAFPMIQNEANQNWGDAEDQVMNCFSLRFLERFALPMGLIEIDKKGIYFDKNVHCRTSSFFKENIEIEI